MTKEWLVSTGFGNTRDDLTHLIGDIYGAQIRHNLMSNGDMGLLFNTYSPYAWSDDTGMYGYEQQFRLILVLKVTSMHWVPITMDMSSLLHTAQCRDDQTRDRLVSIVSDFYQGMENLDLEWAHRLYQPFEIECSIGL